MGIPTRALCWLVFAGLAMLSVSTAAQWKYPPAPTSDAADTWHGKRYEDPYRPLENTADQRVAAWYKSQAELTDGTLAKISGRDALVREWLSMDKRTPPRYRQFQLEGGRLFYRKTVGGENVGKIYFRQGWEGKEQLLFDPTTYKKGSDTAVKLFVPSFDGKNVVLGLAAKGAEWSELRVLRVDDKQLLPDSIYPAGWFGVGWFPDSAAFLYNGGDVTDVKSADIELNRKIRIHKLGSPTSDDRDILSNTSTPELEIASKEIPIGSVPESQPDRLIGAVYTVQPEMRLYVASVSALSGAHVACKSLVHRSDNLVRGYLVYGEWLYAVTPAGAPHYRVVRSLIDKPDWKNSETVVPEAADSIDSIAQSENYMVVAYSDGDQRPDCSGSVVNRNTARSEASDHGRGRGVLSGHSQRPLPGYRQRLVAAANDIRSRCRQRPGCEEFV